MIEARRLRKEIQIPKGVEVTLGEKLIVKKGKYVISKKLSYPTIELKKEEEKLVIIPKLFTKKEKKIIKSIKPILQKLKDGHYFLSDALILHCFSFSNLEAEPL